MDDLDLVRRLLQHVGEHGLPHVGVAVLRDAARHRKPVLLLVAGELLAPVRAEAELLAVQGLGGKSVSDCV